MDSTALLFNKNDEGIKISTAKWLKNKLVLSITVFFRTFK